MTADRSFNIPTKINIPQAVFGAMLGVWYTTVTRNIFECKSINTDFTMPINLVKSLYLVVSLIAIISFTLRAVKFQQYISSLESQRDGKFSFEQFGTMIKEGAKRFVLVLVFLEGFLLTTGLIFILKNPNPPLNIFDLVFGGLQPIVWCIVEASTSL